MQAQRFTLTHMYIARTIYHIVEEKKVDFRLNLDEFFFVDFTKKVF